MSPIDTDYRATFSVSERLSRRARDVMPSGITHDARHLEPFPVYVESASGSRKRTVEGFELIDYAVGHGALIYGHCPPYAVEILDRCNRGGSHFSACHPLEVEWAERVCAMVPSAERVRFTMTGTEATHLALRLARAATGRTKVLRLTGHFHGWHDYVCLGHVPPYDRPSSAGISEATLSTVTVANADDLAEIDSRLATREFAALILEPGGAAAGCVPLDASYLRHLRERTSEAGTLLVFDEVVSGFRWAPGGAQEWFRVVPDMTTLGKILGGGVPAAAVAGRADVMNTMAFRPEAEWNRFSRVSHAGTWNAFHHSAALGVATLDRLADGTVQDETARLAATLQEGMNQKIRESGLSGCVYGERSTIRIVLDGPGVLPDLPPDEFVALVPSSRLLEPMPQLLRSAFWKASLLEGVDWLSGQHGWPSAAHSAEDLELTIEAFGRTLQRVVGELDSLVVEEAGQAWVR